MHGKTYVILIVFAVLVGTMLWLLTLGTEDTKVRHQSPIPSQMFIGDDCAYRDESLLFRTNGDAVSAPSQASEKNQAMDRLMAGRDMAPDDFSALMRRLHADGKQDELTRNFAVQHLGLYVQRRIRLGEYNPDSREALEIRSTLEKALAELAAVDPELRIENGELRISGVISS